MSDDLLRLRTAGALAVAEPAQDTSQASSPGSLVGSSGLVYRPLRQLGEGGMARVFLACALGGAGFSKLVVLKVMRRYLEGSDYRAMFLQEARVSARLDHPNLVQVYEVVDHEEAPYIVMEYLEGKPLSELRRQTAITRDMMLTVVCEALVGLHYAHEVANFDGSSLHIVHRDVSPHNVFVTYDGAVKVLDFGVAKIASEGHTQTGEIRGKLTYMAPEQFLGQEIDRRADVFAMGAVLWEMVLGTPLWDKTDQGLMLQRLAMGDIPRPSPSANLDPELEAIIVRATAANPDERYATALDMQQALIAYRDRQPKVFTPREVGEALATAFEAERTKDRLAVREALAEALAAADEVGVSEAPPAPEPTEPVRRWPLLLAGLVLVSLLLVLATRLIAPKSEAPSAATPPPPAPTAASSARLVFRVRPVTAQVEIDGQLRGTGTFELVVPADSVQHRVIISAPDHEPSARLVPFAGTQELDIVLAVTPPQPAPSSSAGEASAGTKGRGVAGSARFGAGAKRIEAGAPGSAAAGAARCDPPYYFKDGIKTFRPECL